MDTSIIKLRVRDLIPYARNPRRNDEAVEVVKYSLQEFGYINRIVVDCNGEIIAGHTRLLACEQLGRRCRTMEMDPRYCDVIVKRWEDTTGRKAVRP